MQSSCEKDSGGDQLPAIMPDHGEIDNDARLDRASEADLREMLGAAELAGFGKTTARGADLRVEMPPQRLGALVAQAARTLLDQVTPELRHARSRRAGPRRERKHVQMGEAAGVHQVEGVLKHRLG